MKTYVKKGKGQAGRVVKQLLLRYGNLLIQTMTDALDGIFDFCLV